MTLSRNKKIALITIPVALILIATIVLTTVFFCTQNDALEFIDIPVKFLDDGFLSTVDDTGDYLGHPDLALADDGTLFCAYPAGHGKGEVIMKTSSDYGDTWSGRLTNLPESWKKSQETPTLYNLHFSDGSSKLLLVSGCPSWSEDDEYYADGFNCSVSSDNGKTWTEFENFYGIEWANSQPSKTAETNTDDPLSPNYGDDGKVLPYDVIVSMSSLTQLKENGEYIDAWMGTFHDYDFYVYTTSLTFNEDGSMEWSEPERLLGQNDEYREVESREDFCEVEILRSPDGKELAAIFRAQAHYTFSYVSFSTDEGVTWSEPQQLCKELTGDRHKAEYDPVSGKLIITMRSINFHDNNPNLGWTDEREDASRGWVAWIGDYEDLKKGEEGCGDMLVKLAHTYGTSGTEITEFANADTGYAGLVVLADGTVVTTSYGTFSPVGSELGGKTYVMTKQFKIADLAAVGGVTLR